MEQDLMDYDADQFFFQSSSRYETFACADDDEDSYCQGCGKDTPKSELAHVEGWNYMGCRDCAAEAYEIMRCEAIAEASEHFAQLEAEHQAQQKELAEIEACEPECACRQTDVDLFDPRGCELHNSQSDWNCARRSLTMIELYCNSVKEVA